MPFPAIFAGSKLIKFIAWAAAILIVAGLILWGISLIYGAGYDSGEAKANAKWEKKHKIDLAKKIDNIKLLREVIRTRELEFAEAQSTKHAEYKEDIKNVEHGKDMLINAIMDGTIKLHLPANNNGNGDGAISGGNDGKTATGGPLAGDNGKKGCQLNTEVTAALYGITQDGDEGINQLAEAQKYIRAMFKQCSGLTPPPWMVEPVPTE